MTRLVAGLVGGLVLVVSEGGQAGYGGVSGGAGARVRPGGWLLVGDVLWVGRVVVEGVTDADTGALQRFNELVAGDARVEVVVLTAFDGVTIARKR